MKACANTAYMYIGHFSSFFFTIIQNGTQNCETAERRDKDKRPLLSIHVKDLFALTMLLRDLKFQVAFLR